MDVGDDVVPVELDRRALRGAQGDVQHGAALGDVDRLAGEHRVAPLGDAGGRGDVEQGGHHGVVDALLGVVDAQVADLEQVALGAPGIGGEQLARCGRAWRGAAHCGVDVMSIDGDVRARSAAAGSSTTRVLVRRTRAIGSSSSPSSHAATASALSAPVISTTRPRAALTTPGVSVMRTRPWYSPDSATGRSLSMTGSPGGHDAVCPSGPIPRWTTSKRSGRRRGVARCTPVEVGGGDGHQVVRSGEAGEVVGVAVGVAVGGDPLVDLPDADPVPRQVDAREDGEHRRGGRPAGHGQRRLPRSRSATPSRRAMDRAAHPAASTSTRIVIRPATHPSVPRRPSAACAASAHRSTRMGAHPSRNVRLTPTSPS